MKLKNPGIGRYTLNEEVMVRTARAPAFSMGHKTKPSDLRHTIDAQNTNPSPAEYDNNPELSKTLFGSQFKKTSFGFSHSKRFIDASIFLVIQTIKYRDLEITKIQQICPT